MASDLYDHLEKLCDKLKERVEEMQEKSKKDERDLKKIHKLARNRGLKFFEELNEESKNAENGEERSIIVKSALHFLLNSIVVICKNQYDAGNLSKDFHQELPRALKQGLTDIVNGKLDDDEEDDE